MVTCVIVDDARRVFRGVTPPPHLFFSFSFLREASAIQTVFSGLTELVTNLRF